MSSAGESVTHRHSGSSGAPYDSRPGAGAAASCPEALTEPSIPSSTQRWQLAGLVAVFAHHAVDLVGHVVERWRRLDVARHRLVEAELENGDHLARFRELIDADGVLQGIRQRLHPAEFALLRDRIAIACRVDRYAAEFGIGDLRIPGLEPFQEFEGAALAIIGDVFGNAAEPVAEAGGGGETRRVRGRGELHLVDD